MGWSETGGTDAGQVHRGHAGGASQAGVGGGGGGGVPYLRGAPRGEALIGDGRGGRLVGWGAGASAVLLQSRCLRQQTGQDAHRAPGLASRAWPPPVQCLARPPPLRQAEYRASVGGHLSPGPERGPASKPKSGRGRSTRSESRTQPLRVALGAMEGQRGRPLLSRFRALTRRHTSTHTHMHTAVHTPAHTLGQGRPQGVRRLARWQHWVQRRGPGARRPLAPMSLGTSPLGNAQTSKGQPPLHLNDKGSWCLTRPLGAKTC